MRCVCVPLYAISFSAHNNACVGFITALHIAKNTVDIATSLHTTITQKKGRRQSTINHTLTAQSFLSREKKKLEIKKKIQKDRRRMTELLEEFAKWCLTNRYRLTALELYEVCGRYRISITFFVFSHIENVLSRDASTISRYNEFEKKNRNFNNVVNVLISWITL